MHCAYSLLRVGPVSQVCFVFVFVVCICICVCIVDKDRCCGHAPNALRTNRDSAIIRLDQNCIEIFNAYYQPEQASRGNCRIWFRVRCWQHRARCVLPCAIFMQRQTFFAPPSLACGSPATTSGSPTRNFGGLRAARASTGGLHARAAPRMPIASGDERGRFQAEAVAV